MGTSKHKSIYMRLLQLMKIGLRSYPGHIILRPALLGQWDKQRTCLREHLGVGVEPLDGTGISAALDRAGRTNHTNPSTVAHFDCTPGARLYYPHHRYR